MLNCNWVVIIYLFLDIIFSKKLKGYSLKIVFLILLNLSFLFGEFDLETKRYNIEFSDKNSIKVNIGNLTIGQSGVVLNNYLKNDETIIATATVVKSMENSTILKIHYNDMFNQDAIPNSKLKVKKNDTLLINHLYKNSLLLVPNHTVKNIVKKLYKKQRFLSEDFFASYLKLNDNPIPKQKDMIKFCHEQQIGTIFITIENKLYILDANSFKLLDKITLNIKSNEINVPFFSKIKDIEVGFWNFGDKKIKNYNQYYKKLLGLK